MNRILIVEDEVPIAQLIEMSLARAGYQCEAVNDGCAAADKIEQNDYDLVLLDIMLPGLDGYELLDAMCGIHVEQPAISAPVPEDEYYRYNPGTRS